MHRFSLLLSNDQVMLFQLSQCTKNNFRVPMYQEQQNISTKGRLFGIIIRGAATRRNYKILCVCYHCTRIFLHLPYNPTNNDYRIQIFEREKHTYIIIECNIFIWYISKADFITRMALHPLPRNRT